MVTNTNIKLTDKFCLEKQEVFLTGNQAIARLVLMQKQVDKKNNINSGGYITGYRGSPISALDTTLGQQQKLLIENDIIFEPALNEDLAATALWGSQQIHLHGEHKYDGVFGIWYGKGPGVDRSGDVFRHANLAGTAEKGGVLVLMGDDHIAESSTTAHQSEFHLIDYGLPIFAPANVQELIDYGLYGFALSRYAGVWVGMKCVKDIIETTAVVKSSIDKIKPIIPEKVDSHIRANDAVLAQEERLHEIKAPAILNFLRQNKLNKTFGSKDAKLGIVAAGKSYLDLCQALENLGVDLELDIEQAGIRIFKPACVSPMVAAEIKNFAKGLKTILVIEEKRALIEEQIVKALYGTKNSPIMLGKKNENGEWLLPIKGALDAGIIAPIIVECLANLGDKNFAKKAKQLKENQEKLASDENLAQRLPYFCAGCPHNSSTIIPEGARAYAGIGCHYMVQWMGRETSGFTHMGGEGANWLGEHHFVNREHIFQNLGDGTYNHSGLMAVRAAVAAGANITYKILYNDAVAMTGGQANDGGLSVETIANQVHAFGAKKIAIVSDEPQKYEIEFPKGTQIHHRKNIIAVQEELAKTKGTTILIYDQTCAAEKRRRRKRGTFPDPDKRIIINERVCESCGDCGIQSNCVAIGAVATPFGRKRQIDQSSCNKDFSCLDGFCPSFVTVHGTQPKSVQKNKTNNLPKIAEPKLPSINKTYGIIISGVGGTGVVTIGAILGMAAHLEGKGSAVLDMAGLAQKGGEVLSHLRIANKVDDIKAVRISTAGANLILACDMVTAASQKVLACIKQGTTKIIVNDYEKLSGEFTQNKDFAFPTSDILQRLENSCGKEFFKKTSANNFAVELLGDAIAANMFMLGFAWQSGAVPLEQQSILRAIELNGVQIEMNQQAFQWGRAAASDEKLLPTMENKTEHESLDAKIEFFANELVQYHNQAYADEYKTWANKIKKLDSNEKLSLIVAKNLYKLMAIKDEYEVGRLFTNGEFAKQLADNFATWKKIEFHLAPPFFANRQKRVFGSWVMHVFKILAKLKCLRGTKADIFAYTRERKKERHLLSKYKQDLTLIAEKINSENYARAIELANWPQMVRGFGHIKLKTIKSAERKSKKLRKRFAN